MKVWAYSVPDGVWRAATTTDASGTTSFPSLTAGSIVCRRSTTNAYPTTWYVHGSSFATGNDVVVPVGGAAPARPTSTSPRPGSITGTARHLGAPVSNVTPFLTLASTAGLVATTTTDALGAYTFGSIAPGTYKIAFADNNGLYPAAGYYADQPDVGSATVISVVVGVSSVADQHLYTAAE